MKPLKVKPEYISCDKWVRINYKNISASAHGYYIMKRTVYEDNRKRFEKLFKDSLIEIIYDYPVSLYDIVDSAIHDLKYQFYIIEYKRNRELNRSYCDENYIDELTSKMTKLHSKIVRLERKLNYETH